jgi:predicted small metal-binding protein
MDERVEAVELVVKCECGFEARGTEEELIPVVQRHGEEAHNMKVTRDQVLAMSRPA